MNVLFVVHEFPPLGGGAGVWVRTLADAVVAPGGRAEVLTLGSPGAAYAAAPYAVTPVAAGRASTAYGDVLSLLRFQRAARLAVAQRVAAGNWDCVYAHFTVPAGMAALAGVADAGAAGKVPVVVDISGADIYDPDRFALVRPLLNTMNRKVVRNAKLVIAPSKDMAQRCHALTGVRPEVVYRAVDTERFRPEAADPALLRRLGVPEGGKCLLTVGRLVERKNLSFAVAVTAELVKRGLPVYHVIAGEGPERARLERLVEVCGLQERVIFAGRVPDADLPGLFAAADLFLLTSHYEALGIVLIEALAAGTPVLAPAVGGIPEIAPADSPCARWLPPDRPISDWLDAAVRQLGQKSQTATAATEQDYFTTRFSVAKVVPGWSLLLSRRKL